MGHERVQVQQKDNSEPANAEKVPAQAKTPSPSSPYFPPQVSSLLATGSPDDIPLTPDNLLFFQRTIGNRAVVQLLQQRRKSSQAGGPRASETDHQAGPVMRLRDTHLEQRAEEPGSVQMAPIQRLCQECEDDAHRRPQEEAQTRPIQTERADEQGLEDTQSVETLLQSSKGGGRSVPASDRGRFESSFNHDFSQVSVHTDGAADSLNRSLNARAFTTGHDIYFRQGEYQPGSSNGQELLAHELTHVVQQEAGPVSGTHVGGGMSISDPSDRHEQAAAQTAKTVVQDFQDHAASPAPESPSSPAHGAAISRASIQRQDAAPAPVTAAQLIEKHTNIIGDLDEKALGQELAGMLPAKTNFVHEVLDKLGTSDRDDVAYEIAVAPDMNLKNLNTGMRMRLIRELVSGVVIKEEEGAIATIWISFEATPGEFEPALREAAETNRDLWKKSLWESEQLGDHIKPIKDSFGADVKGLALEYLAGNKQSLMDEAKRYGIDLEGEKSATPTQTDYLESVRAIVPGVLRLKGFLEELKQIRVGYHRVGDCIAGECKHESMFNPDYAPEMPPTGEESPPWPKWQDVKTQYDRTSALIAAFANIYPTIYILMQQDKLDTLGEAGDAAKAQEIIMTSMRETEEKIKESKQKIAGGDITYYDLKMIQTQLFSGPAQIPYEPKYHWEQPFYQDIANDDIKGHEARQFWVDLGLSLLAAAALIAAPFTGGATAAFLIGFGLGIGATQAGMSWDKYLDKSTVADATVKKELMLISEGEVSAQLVDAVVQTVALFLDIYGVKASTTAARQSIKAFEAAEKGLKEELAAAAKKQALREAGKEGALVLGGAGLAVGMHELGEDEPVPDFEGKATHNRIDLGPDTPATSSTPVNKAIQRQGGGVPAAPAVPKQPIILTGGEFELYVEKALLKGPLGGVPQMSFVLPLQYRGGSGWGVDRIGIVFDEAAGVIDVYHLEMKFVSPGSPHVPSLGQRGSGTQTGKGWTDNAIEGFLGSNHPNARAAKERLRRALQKMHPNDTIDIARMRNFLEARLPTAQVRVFVPDWADFSKLYKQVAALIRHGREIKIVKLFK